MIIDIKFEVIGWNYHCATAKPLSRWVNNLNLYAEEIAQTGLT